MASFLHEFGETLGIACKQGLSGCVIFQRSLLVECRLMDNDIDFVCTIGGMARTTRLAKICAKDNLRVRQGLLMGIECIRWADGKSCYRSIFVLLWCHPHSGRANKRYENVRRA